MDFGLTYRDMFGYIANSPKEQHRQQRRHWDVGCVHCMSDMASLSFFNSHIMQSQIHCSFMQLSWPQCCQFTLALRDRDCWCPIGKMFSAASVMLIWPSVESIVASLLCTETVFLPEESKVYRGRCPESNCAAEWQQKYPGKDAGCAVEQICLAEETQPVLRWN